MAIDFEPMKTVNEYWGDKMPMMACEEMAELIQAISKFERHYLDEAFELREEYYKLAIVTEMADVSIACAALCDRYGITPADVGEAIYKKLDKKY